MTLEHVQTIALVAIATCLAVALAIGWGGQ